MPSPCLTQRPTCLLALPPPCSNPRRAGWRVWRPGGHGWRGRHCQGQRRHQDYCAGGHRAAARGRRRGAAPAPRVGQAAAACCAMHVPLLPRLSLLPAGCLLASTAAPLLPSVPACPSPCSPLRFLLLRLAPKAFHRWPRPAPMRLLCNCGNSLVASGRDAARAPSASLAGSGGSLRRRVQGTCGLPAVLARLTASAWHHARRSPATLATEHNEAPSRPCPAGSRLLPRQSAASAAGVRAVLHLAV